VEGLQDHIGGIVLSIDPGTKAIGWAYWVNGKLSDCGIARGKNWIESVEDLPRIEVSRLVVEDQQIYKSSPVDAHDLLAVARVVGAVVVLYDAASVKLVRPSEWKGQVPKVVCNRRTIERLSEAERDILTRKPYGKTLLHNLLDAVGIGLWELKRRRK